MRRSYRTTLKVLIPRAIALHYGEGVKWQEVCKRLETNTTTLHRWRKRPEWAEAKARFDAEVDRIKAEQDADRKELRRRTLDILEAQRRVAGDAFVKALDVVIDVLGRPPRSADVEKFVIADDGEPKLVEVTKKPPVDEAATLASRLATGGGLRGLADMAVRGPFVPAHADQDPAGAAAAAKRFRIALKEATVAADTDIEEMDDSEATG